MYGKIFLMALALELSTRPPFLKFTLSFRRFFGQNMTAKGFITLDLSGFRFGLKRLAAPLLVFILGITVHSFTYYITCRDSNYLTVGRASLSSVSGGKPLFLNFWSDKHDHLAAFHARGLQNGGIFLKTLSNSIHRFKADCL